MCIEENRAKIKAILHDLQSADVSSTVRLIAILEAVGITDRSEVEALTASKPSTVREARRTLEIQRQKSSADDTTAGNPAPEIQRTARIPALAPEIQRQKSSAIVCADITTRATKELPSEVLSPSEVKRSEVGVFSPKAQTKTENRGTRLPEDFQVPKDWIVWTETNCPCSTPAMVAVEAIKFANYWQSLAGAKARKANWKKTWQNWSLTAFSSAPLRPSGTVSSGHAPWVEAKLKGQREALKIAAELGYA
jgi:hypothetical protein